MQNITLRVNQEDIDAANLHRATHGGRVACYCPIAQAMQRTFPHLGQIVAEHDYLATLATALLLAVPTPTMIRYMRNFEIHEPVKPKGFRLRLL